MSYQAVCRKGTLLILTGPVDHLHIVMNDPVFYPESGVESVLVVNVSSIRGIHDSTCILNVGSHPFVRHSSYISYRHAAIVSATKLANEIANGDIAVNVPVSDEVFDAVMAGFPVSQHVTPKIRRFLKNYVP